MKKAAATLIALGLSTVAFAQQRAPSAPAEQPRQATPEQQRGGSAQVIPFDAVDKNKDGQLNRDEASTVPGLDFAAADANKNSALDRQEYTAAIARIQSPRG
jgi:hypothetical protein